MSISLANNVSSLKASTNFGRSRAALNLSLQRLSTGLRVNRAADGPAALVVSESLRAQIGGLRAAIDNTNKAVSLVRTAEGALNEVSNLLLNARGLAVRSANGAVTETSAAIANQVEFTNILGQIDRIAANSQFGTRRLLDGSAADLSAITNNFSRLSDLSVGTASPVGNLSVAVGGASGGTVRGGFAAFDHTLLGSFLFGADPATDGSLGGAGSELTVTGGGLLSPVTVDLSGQSTVDGAVAAVQSALGSGFTVSGTDGLVFGINATNSNQSLTLSFTSAVASTRLGFGGTLNNFGTPFTSTLTVTGGGLAAARTIDLAGTTTTAELLARVQSDLNEVAGAGAFTVRYGSLDVGDAAADVGKLIVTSNISVDAVTLQSGDFDTELATGVASTAPETGTAGAVATATTVASGLATGGRGAGSNRLGSGTLSVAGTVTASGGGLSSPVVVNLSNGDSATSVVSKVQAALDGAAGAGKFLVSGTSGGRLVVQSNLLGSSAITLQSDSTTTAEFTGVSDAGLGDEGITGNGLQVFIGSAAATVSSGPDGLENQVTLGGASGLSFNVGVDDGQTVSSSQNVIRILRNGLTFQIGSEAGQRVRLSINPIGTDLLGGGAIGAQSLSQVTLTTPTDAAEAIQAIDRAIGDVSSLRQNLGAFQANTLETNARSLQVALTNITSAVSVIRDTDYAQEIADFVKAQIQLTGGAAVIGFANQFPRLVVQLLDG